MSVTVDKDGLIQAVRNNFGIEVDSDMADRMCSTILPALQDLEAARRAVPHVDGEPSSFDKALMDLAPERIARQAAIFKGEQR